MEDKNFSRRRFLANAAAISAVGAVGVGALASCKEKKVPLGEAKVPPLLDQAPDGKPLKAGVIGCGGRGSGAAINFLNAGPNLSVVALGDVLKDRVMSCREKLIKEKNHEVSEANCFVGFDAYQKVIDSGVDVVIMAAPPKFRPKHFDAAVQARKHVFMEKPIAVDPVGVRAVMVSSKKADAAMLKVITGTQRRHQRDYVDIYKKVMEGEIGDIVAANCYWNGSQLWYRKPRPEWSEMEYMIRDWVNWTWLSGDHIVEQHIHNIDVVNWFSGSYPKEAVGMGSRQRRVTGDQFDNFSIDYKFDNNMHLHSMCRQVNGCVNNVSEYIRGTKGYTNCRNTIWDKNGAVVYEYKYPLSDSGEPMRNVKVSPYLQEHIDLVTCIRQNIEVNEAEGTAISNMVAIMGRISAYTGRKITWDQMMNSDLLLGPKTYVMGKVGMKAEIPVPGKA